MNREFDHINDVKELISRLDKNRMPEHVAIIMDGNGRWARERSRERSEGHSEGVHTVRNITEIAVELNIKYLTLYAFSTENWNRPPEEVKALMHLIGWAIRNELEDLKANNVRINLLGDIQRLPEEVHCFLKQACEETADNTGLNLNLCLSYSSRWELTRAMRKIADEVLSGVIAPSDINEKRISSHLCTAGMPDPDLLIRTGGEERVSNFLLWQIAYSELYFTPVLWPDFDKAEFVRAVLDYQSRERRFGKTSDQVKTEIN